MNMAKKIFKQKDEDKYTKEDISKLLYMKTPENMYIWAIMNSSDQGVFSIKGKRVEKLIAMTDFDNPVSLRRFERAWKFMGLDKLLKKEGIQEGDTVNLYGVEFSFSDKKGCSDIPGESEGKSC